MQAAIPEALEGGPVPAAASERGAPGLGIPSTASPGWTAPPWLRGVLVTLLALVLIDVVERELARFPNPDALYLTAVVYAAFSGGLAAGLASAALTLCYAVYFYATPGAEMLFSHENALRLGVLAVATPALAVMVGLLRGRLLLQLARATESEARTRAAAATLSAQAQLLDLAHDTIMVRRMDGQITFWNQGAQEMYGFTREEAVGRSSHGLLRTVFPEPLPVLEAELLKHGRWEGELTHVRRDGRPVVVASRWALQRDAAGGPVAVLEINNDVTERKRAERDLERLSRHNELILNSAGEGIYGLDLRGIATFVNPAAARTLGYEVEEMIGRRIHELVHRQGPDGASYPAERCPVLATLSDGVVRLVGDELYARKDGSLIPVEYVSTPVKEQDRIVGAVVAFRDITERLAVERVKDELVSVVSHELRTPLASIRGALGLLAGGALGTLPERGQRLLDMAVASTDRLTRLVSDILDVERMESGKLVLAKDRVDGRALLLHAVDMMRPVAEQHAVDLVVGPGTAEVYADGDRILQTLTNLVDNAVKFSPPETSVVLSVGDTPEGVLFEVKDLGRGIPVDRLGRIFERFEQVDATDAREKGGTGLGLAICKRIVEQHGGRIWAEPHPGQGSTFRFVIPRPAEEEAPAPPAAQAARAPRRAVAGRRLLVIDDDDIIREVAQISLESGGAEEVLTAPSGIVGVDVARGSRPDAILLDVMMPDEDGTAIYLRLKEDPSTRHIPVILLTAKAQAADHRRFASLGVAGVIPKPFDPMKLAAEVARTLGWLA